MYSTCIYIGYTCTLNMYIQMNDQQDSGYPMDGGHSWENHQGLENSSYPPQQPYAMNDSRREYQDYPHGPSPEGQQQPGGFDEEVGPQITADIDR